MTINELVAHNKLLTAKQVMEILGIGQTKFFRLLKQRTPLPHYKIGKNLRFKFEEITYWIENYRVN